MKIEDVTGGTGLREEDVKSRFSRCSMEGQFNEVQSKYSVLSSGALRETSMLNIASGSQCSMFTVQ
jgi:hypothetical protein